jgi:hypothetical protein
MSLLDLFQEVLNHILSFLDVTSLLRMEQVNRYLRDKLRSDVSVWQRVSQTISPSYFPSTQSQRWMIQSIKEEAYRQKYLVAEYELPPRILDVALHTESSTLNYLLRCTADSLTLHFQEECYEKSLTLSRHCRRKSPSQQIYQILCLSNPLSFVSYAQGTDQSSVLQVYSNQRLYFTTPTFSCHVHLHDAVSSQVWT